MVKLRVSMVLVSVALLSAACGSSSDGGSGAGSVASSGDDSTGGEPTVVTSATVAPVDTVLPTPPAGGGVECLQGTWVQGAQRMQDFLSQVGTPIALTVLPDSLATLTISGDSVSITSTITLQVVTGDMMMQATGSGVYSGTFTADATTLDVALASQEYSMGEWIATVDGETVSMPGMTAVDPGPPIGGPGSYACTDTTLEAITSGGVSTFDRA